MGSKKRKTKRRTRESYLPKSEAAAARQREGQRKGYARSLEVRRARARQRLLDQQEARPVPVKPVDPKRFGRMTFLAFLDHWPLDNGLTFGSQLEPWQTAFVEGATRRLSSDLPRFKRILNSIPRQSGKTELLAAYGAWRTLTVGGATVSIAMDLDQARLQHARLVRALRRNPALADCFDLSAIRGNQIWREDGGGYWAFLPRDEASAGGHVVSTLLCDEVGQFPRGSWSFIAQVSPSPAVAHGQSFFSGFKGPLQHRTEGAPLFDLIAQLEAGAADLFGVNVEGRSPASWHTDEFLEAARRQLPPNVFEQLYMNRWSEGDDQFLSITMVEGAVDPSLCAISSRPASGEAVVLGLDVGLVKDRSVLSAVAHGGSAGARLIRQRVWAGSHDEPVDLGEVEAAAAAMYHDLGASLVIGDPWQAVYLLERLQGRGIAVEVYKFTAGSVQRMAAGVYNLFSRGGIRIPDDPELKAELLSLTTKATTAGYKWEHPSGGHDDRVVALALACSPLFLTEPAALERVVVHDVLAEYQPNGLTVDMGDGNVADLRIVSGLD
jgi:hypothetical protein